MTSLQDKLPLVIAGPILRRLDDDEHVLWLVTSEAIDATTLITDASGSPQNTQSCHQQIQVGTHCFVSILSTTTTTTWQPGEKYQYTIEFSDASQQNRWLEAQKALLYPEQSGLSFRYQPKLTNVLHGSCRKPHFDGKDALSRLDDEIANEFTSDANRPDLIIFSGDQIYADDVAGPMLQAIHQLSYKLDLFDETLDGATINSGRSLWDHPNNFYEREALLPKVEANDVLTSMLFNAKRKPVFTSVHAQNHLLTLAEIMAMYLLSWSDTPWQLIALDPSVISDAHRPRFDKETAILDDFRADLPRVKRAMAHIPVYMIFDDHDVTDDWNLTVGWEQEVYQHPLSRRMIGNALIAYWLCQGWGNQPDKFDDIYTKAQSVFTPHGLVGQDAFIDGLFEFEQWHYSINTSPPIRVLDTRTRRWRSESSMNKPSGLMDWEALCEFQHSIINQSSVIVVSAAPIYGVKFIEAVQKVFTFFGKALTVDAENWMAHKGTASVILNVFRHYKTPPNFFILSGDVHYSFVYDVRLRFRRNSPRIVQFTCSGYKNAFPSTLLSIFETLNRWFYGPKSILNYFTRRRYMKIRARTPSKRRVTLLNKPAIGQMLLNETGDKVICRALCNDGETVEFRSKRNSEDK